MPPKNIPGISSNPVFHETNPCFEYAISAKAPVGKISATKDVPCARCWLKANSSPRRGTRRTPPPTPNMARRHTANARGREDANASAKTLSLSHGLPLYSADGTALKLRLFLSRNPVSMRKQPNNPLKFRDGMGRAIKLPA